MLARFVMLFLMMISAGSAWAQDFVYVDIKYPPTITVTKESDQDNSHHVRFIVDLNSEKISSFHVKSSLTGDLHYIAHDAYTLDFIDYTTIIGAWQFEADNNGSFGWQSTYNHDASYGEHYVFEITSDLVTEDTTYQYSFDLKVPVPEANTEAMLLVGLGFISVMAKRRRRTV